MNQSETDLYRQLFDLHPAVKLLLDPETAEIIDANLAALSFYGYARDALIGNTLMHISRRPAREILADVEQAMRGDRIRIQCRQQLSTGAVVDVDLQAGPVHIDGRELLHVIVQDVTDQHLQYEQLLAYREIYERLPIAFYRVTPGPDGRFLEFNDAFMDLFEADTREQLLSRRVASIYVDPQSREQFSDTLLARHRVFRHELHLLTLKGNQIWVADTSYRHVNDAGQEVFDGVLEDITERKRLERELERRATRDDLTGLYNRGHASDLLDKEIQRIERYGGQLGALMFDLDHFKGINDTFGHPTGDEVLRQVGALLREATRDTDTASRWGGEEFLVIMPGTGDRGVFATADKLRVQVRQMRFATVGQVTISVGAATYRAGEGEDALLRRLDRALYEAKRRGRDCLVEAS